MSDKTVSESPGRLIYANGELVDDADAQLAETPGGVPNAKVCPACKGRCTDLEDDSLDCPRCSGDGEIGLY